MAVLAAPGEQGGVSPPPPDWCCVDNLELPHKPNAIRLPPGKGARLRDDMKQLVEDLRAAIPAAFESEDYRSRIEELEQALKERQQRPQSSPLLTGSRRRRKQ